MAFKIDKLSASWLAVAEHANERLVVLRKKLEANLSADDTLIVRTQIRELNAILQLVAPIEEPLAEEQRDF
jgi:hypothetical protein